MSYKGTKIGGYKEMIDTVNWDEQKKAKLVELLEAKSTAEAVYSKGVEEMGLKPTVRTMHILESEEFDISFCSMSFGSQKPKDLDKVRKIIAKSTYREIKSIESEVEFAETILNAGEINQFIELLFLVKYGRELLKGEKRENLLEMVKEDAQILAGALETAAKLVK